MAQPVAALLDPDTDTTAMPACPDFCDSTCAADEEPAGEAHHSNGGTVIALASSRPGRTIEWWISASRTDADFQAGVAEVNLFLHRGHADSVMTPAEARKFAATLLNAADQADPLPYGVLPIPAKQVRIGDEISTPLGWQTVIGQMVFANQANVWTDDDGHDLDTDGWDFEPGDVVRVRRRIHGSCALQFEEPQR
jgi:hypothetical protein